MPVSDPHTEPPWASEAAAPGVRGAVVPSTPSHASSLSLAGFHVLKGSSSVSKLCIFNFPAQKLSASPGGEGLTPAPSGTHRPCPPHTVTLQVERGRRACSPVSLGLPLASVHCHTRHRLPGPVTRRLRPALSTCPLPVGPRPKGGGQRPRHMRRVHGLRNARHHRRPRHLPPARLRRRPRKLLLPSPSPGVGGVTQWVLSGLASCAPHRVLAAPRGAACVRLSSFRPEGRRALRRRWPVALSGRPPPDSSCSAGSRRRPACHPGAQRPPLGEEAGRVGRRAGPRLALPASSEGRL